MRDDIKLTDDEHEALMGAVIAKMHNKEMQVVPVVESIVAARLDAALARNAELEAEIGRLKEELERAYTFGTDSGL